MYRGIVVAIKRDSDRFSGGKACIVCGKRGQAKLNGEIWFCGEHAREPVMLSPMSGQTAMEAVRGELLSLMGPTSAISDY